MSARIKQENKYIYLVCIKNDGFNLFYQIKNRGYKRTNPNGLSFSNHFYFHLP